MKQVDTDVLREHGKSSTKKGEYINAAHELNIINVFNSGSAWALMMGKWYCKRTSLLYMFCNNYFLLLAVATVFPCRLENV